ncbi:AraC family transcriptional regulator [uncultured Flavobacterium sp.]|uniref:helix-turn-helix transcriptional regulator n=1 Tax=uncultured Flavobacterium sp. TaxID=165435 RepID=UPI00292D5A39|nr:AraC family transcriptional regulator [uncultured Flavobacterium sp.]
MKIIEHSYSADLSWVKHLANELGGKIDGNFILASENIQTGVRYFLEIEEGIVAYYIDAVYHKNLHLIQKNTQTDFIGLYYNLTDGEVSVTKKNHSYNVNRWNYNLSTIDGTLVTDYKVTAGSKTYALCIFIKKSIIESIAKANNITIRNLNRITDPKKNTIIRFDRMSNESYHLLKDLHKLKVGGPVFDLNLEGTVHMLLSNYLKKLSTNRIIIQTVNQADLNNIIAIQKYLVRNIDSHFPSIKLMAEMANMSESKFKSLFKKITGLTSNSFFMENKLLKAKELLENRELTITQISDQLHFTNNSYFTSKFKENFGLSPKTYVKKL